MLRDVAPKPKSETVARSRRLRRVMSPPEIALWQVLRARPAGLKFRRQHPSGDYTLDFYCSDARLAIEIDGEAHGRGDRPMRDARRDRWFAGHGIATVRIPAREALRDLDRVVRGIVVAAQARLPLHHPAAPDGPPPRDKLGEE
ncbi:very-short-patch-repair endonuclease [Hephaestia caeni]|uniref:Very-short-patch-repair endonuclease n=1 Tax=Hephaestia caeni TaxID=645617 RepID=A0A397P857_9SPHN|nr:endonuclease domain-containing protein [Hephaestia caeni]RIA45746.1 very-short-patch-repair endonuclease [Hephaestia caeni]